MKHNPGQSILPLFIVLLVALASCQSYRSNILFTEKDGLDTTRLKLTLQQINDNYRIQPNDILELFVYTKDGERIIDPDFELLKSTGVNNLIGQNRIRHQYLVQEDGVAKLPMVGLVKLDGLNLVEAESILEQAFLQYYNDLWIDLQVVNRRAIVMGAPGGQLVPLLNENMSILEVLAMAGGLGRDARGDRILLIRGPIYDPDIYEIDLTKRSVFNTANLRVYPGDIIYVTPIRRVLTEGVRDISPIISLATSLLTITVLIINLNN